MQRLIHVPIWFWSAPAVKLELTPPQRAQWDWHPIRDRDVLRAAGRGRAPELFVPALARKAIELLQIGSLVARWRRHRSALRAAQDGVELIGGERLHARRACSDNARANRV